MKVHLDTDLGGDPDDVCALAMLLAGPGVELVGVTTSHEREGWRAGWAQEVLRLAGREDVPVAAGSERAFGDEWRVRPVMPPAGEYWPAAVPPAPGAVEQALRLLDASVEAGATVVAIGPPTNLALYERQRPGRLAFTPVALMGGYIVPREGPAIAAGLPQWGPDTDWNLNLDVAATRLVFEVCRPTIVPVNVTLQVHLREADLPRLEAAGALGRLMARQARAVQRERRAGLPEEHEGLPPDLLNFHHDPLACAVAIGWPGARVEELPLRLEIEGGYPVERVVEGGKRYPVVTSVDAGAFSRWWLDVVAPAGESRA